MTQPTVDYDVIVLGAGAAGLMCAMTAAQRGRHVLVLEKSNKIGKKILMSGGGRCNFTNLFVEPENFLSLNPHFCKLALKQYSQWDFIALVERYSIAYEERQHGQLFCEHSAQDILSMLLKECELAEVELRINCEVLGVEAVTDKHEATCNGFDIRIKGTAVPIRCRSLVIATGALSIPTLGGSGFGYDIAEQFSMEQLPIRAGLVPFMFSDSIKPICDRLSGISLEVEVRCNHQVFKENLLFTHRGISGPVILQISNYWYPGDEIEINLLPELDVSDWLIGEKTKHGHSRILSLLNKRLPNSLVTELQTLWWPDSAERPVAEFTDKQLLALGNRFNQWVLKPSATEGYRTAEVTLGGVSTNGLNSRNMEASAHPGLYFIGEVVDVSGQLGGFNFQWAWSSGFSAGMAV